MSKVCDETRPKRLCLRCYRFFQQHFQCGPRIFRLQHPRPEIFMCRGGGGNRRIQVANWTHVSNPIKQAEANADMHPDTEGLGIVHCHVPKIIMGSPSLDSRNRVSCRHPAVIDIECHIVFARALIFDFIGRCPIATPIMSGIDDVKTHGIYDTLCTQQHALAFVPRFHTELRSWIAGLHAGGEIDSVVCLIPFCILSIYSCS